MIRSRLSFEPWTFRKTMLGAAVRMRVNAEEWGTRRRKLSVERSKVGKSTSAVSYGGVSHRRRLADVKNSLRSAPPTRLHGHGRSTGIA